MTRSVVTCAHLRAPIVIIFELSSAVGCKSEGLLYRWLSWMFVAPTKQVLIASTQCCYPCILSALKLG